MSRILRRMSLILKSYTRFSKITEKKGGEYKVFGQMQVTQMLALSKLETLDEAVAKLLEFAEYPKLLRWIQFPTALVVYLAHECGFRKF